MKQPFTPEQLAQRRREESQAIHLMIGTIIFVAMFAMILGAYLSASQFTK
jgi:hypothetical protein